jgi:hypothetical protein
MVIFLNQNFIQSKVFTIHLVTKLSESVHQHVAYVTEHDEACSWILPAASRGHAGSDVGYAGFQLTRLRGLLR